jgi:hypothetical protein
MDEGLFHVNGMMAVQKTKFSISVAVKNYVTIDVKLLFD